MSGHSDTAVAFGENQSLVGVLTEPQLNGSRDTAIILLNAGLLHKVGPYRLSVDIARRAALQGWTTLRFDLGGLGDSAIASSGNIEERTLADIRAAMALLEPRGHRRFVLGGLCSAALNAHRAAVHDPRVAGILSLDGLAYPSPRFYVGRYAPKVVNPMAWWRLARRKLGKTQTDERAPIYDEPFPPRDQVADELRALVKRRVHMLYVFTGEIADLVNHQGQFRRAFSDVPLGELLREVFIVDSDHAFTLLCHRRWLLDLVEDWLAASFPTGDREMKAFGVLQDADG